MTRLLLSFAMVRWIRYVPIAALLLASASTGLRAEQPAPRRVGPAATAARPRSPGRRVPSSQSRRPADETDAESAAPGTELGTTPTSPILEVLVADEYAELVPLDPADDDAIQWDPTSRKFLYVSKEAPAFVFLTGTVRPGYEISWDGRWIATNDERFEIRVPFPVEPVAHDLRVYAPDRSFRTYRFVSHWLKVPASLRTRTADPRSEFSRTVGFTELYRNTPSVQLYSARTAVTRVDLDASKHARLTFRIFPAPLPDIAPDGFRLVLRNSQRQVVGELSRLGAPPEFLDWRDIATNFHSSGRYTYQLTLYKDKRTYEGPTGELEAIEGLSLLNHHYLPVFQLEPKQEIGYFFFNDELGTSFSNLYVGADLPMVLWNRFLFRATGLMTLYSPDPNTSLTYTRVGGGLRFFGEGNSDLLGTPHIFRLDLYLAHTGFTLYQSAPIQRFSQVTWLVEPHLVLWRYHYIVPTIEFGAKPDFTQYRLSLGLSYQFFIRPWSVKLGMGVSYDRLLHFEKNDPNRFSILRTLASFTFFL